MRDMLGRIALSGLLFSSLSIAEAAGDKTVNVRISPLPLVIGMVSGDVAFTLSDTFSAGPSGTYWSFKFEDIKMTIYKLGVRGNYYLSGSTSAGGFYISPEFAYVGGSAKADGEGLTGTATVSGYGFSAIIGRHWMWDTFNLTLGIGYGFASVSAKGTIEDADGEEVSNTTSKANGAGLAIDFFSLGFAF